MNTGEEVPTMSMGWLTESALTLKKAKPISGVDGSTLVDLKAALYERQTMTKDPEFSRSSVRKTIHDVLGTANRGVNDRNARDAKGSSEVEKADSVYAALVRKSEIYDKIVHGKVAGLSERIMVDFETKGWEASSSSSSSVSMNDNFALAAGVSPSLNSEYFDQAAEREAWEAKALEEIKEGDPNRLKRKGGIKLQWDKTLSEQEKHDLKKIEEATVAGREKMDNVKKKRERDRDEKRKKLLAKRAKKQGLGPPSPEPEEDSQEQHSPARELSPDLPPLPQQQTQLSQQQPRESQQFSPSQKQPEQLHVHVPLVQPQPVQQPNPYAQTPVNPWLQDANGMQTQTMHAQLHTTPQTQHRWQQIPDGCGNLYWYNTHTGVSQWEPPCI